MARLQGTGKIFGFDVRIKTGRVCYFHKRHNSTVLSHDCQKNWSGSSKGMQPDVAETVLKGRGGSDGLKRVFAEDNDGSPRITKSKAVLTKLVEYLEKNKKN